MKQKIRAFEQFFVFLDSAESPKMVDLFQIPTETGY